MNDDCSYFLWSQPDSNNFFGVNRIMEYHYGDKVRITDGFYEGLSGIICAKQEEYSYRSSWWKPKVIIPLTYKVYLKKTIT